MPNLTRNRIAAAFRRGDACATAHDKGACLEQLMVYIMRRIPGVRFVASNVVTVDGSEEIDLVFWNNKLPAGLPFLPNILLFECKNWANGVGSPQVLHFGGKLANRHLKFGILVASNGLTGNAEDLTRAHAAIENYYLSQEIVLVVVTRNELERLANTEMLVRLVQDKISEIVLRANIPA